MIFRRFTSAILQFLPMFFARMTGVGPGGGHSRLISGECLSKLGGLYY